MSSHSRHPLTALDHERPGLADPHRACHATNYRTRTRESPSGERTDAQKRARQHPMKDRGCAAGVYLPQGRARHAPASQREVADAFIDQRAQSHPLRTDVGYSSAGRVARVDRERATRSGPSRDARPERSRALRRDRWVRDSSGRSLRRLRSSKRDRLDRAICGRPPGLVGNRRQISRAGVGNALRQSRRYRLDRG